MPDSFNALMDGLDEGLQKAGLGSMKDDADSGSSSSLGKTIQGVTEQTADILASYMNAIRADVSVNRATLSLYMPLIAQAISSNTTLSETQVTLQQQIAANTLRNAEAADRIYDILHASQSGIRKLGVTI